MSVVILAMLQHIIKNIWLHIMYRTTSKENSPEHMHLKIYPARQIRDLN